MPLPVGELAKILKEDANIEFDSSFNNCQYSTDNDQFENSFMNIGQGLQRDLQSSDNFSFSPLDLFDSGSDPFSDEALQSRRLKLQELKES